MPISNSLSYFMFLKPWKIHFRFFLIVCSKMNHQEWVVINDLWDILHNIWNASFKKTECHLISHIRSNSLGPPLCTSRDSHQQPLCVYKCESTDSMKPLKFAFPMKSLDFPSEYAVHVIILVEILKPKLEKP